MSPEEIQAMAKGLAEGQVVWYLGSAVIGGGITGLVAYLTEKGKNRATKEDIREITLAVKEIEAGFNEKLADLQANHQLRMVAAERRIQAHQEAFTNWRLLVDALHTREIEKIDAQITRSNRWFSENCLYLGAKTRQAMSDLLHAVWRQPKIEAAPVLDMDELIGNSQIIDQFLEDLLEEIDLPPMKIKDTIRQ